MLDRKLCKSCGRKIVPIGSSRVNGKWHSDWDTREYHKKCWKEKMIIEEGMMRCRNYN